MGIALESVPADRLHDRAQEVAASFLAGAPIAQMFIKQTINSSFESSFSEALGWEGHAQAIALGTEDSAEGVASFIQKRDPEWKGR